ncbi:MAG: TraB/GumN family protein [Sphingobacteriales bacterium]|nr:MAG: TraB/GumN family protein [Sphingobacteriales bacterium]
MKNVLLIACLLSLFACSSSKKTTTVTPPKDEVVIENALLWQVSGKGLSSPSYVYGTIHIICKEDFQFSGTLKEKFREAKNIYLELDMDDPNMMMKMASLSMMKGQSMKDLMSPADYTYLSAYVKDSLGMPMMLFNKMKPITLMSLLYTKALPCSASESYEQTMVTMAKQQKKDIKGLEKIEDQMAVFDKIPDSVEAKMILDMIKNMPEQKVQFAQMVAAYKKEDLRSLSNAMSESPEWKGFEDIMLSNRNKNWIPVMETAMKESTTLFAVGAGHLYGKEGVINLLRATGYTVTPVVQDFIQKAVVAK